MEVLILYVYVKTTYTVRDVKTTGFNIHVQYQDLHKQVILRPIYSRSRDGRAMDGNLARDPKTEA